MRFDADPWESFDASVALTGDGAVRLVPTPGHTNGHLSVAVETGDELVLIAGDATYAERTLLSGVVDGVADDARAHRDSSARDSRALPPPQGRLPAYARPRVAARLRREARTATTAGGSSTR